MDNSRSNLDFIRSLRVVLWFPLVAGPHGPALALGGSVAVARAQGYQAQHETRDSDSLYDYTNGVDCGLWTALLVTNLKPDKLVGRWSLTFQTYVQLTMLETHTKTSEQSVKMMERSLYSAKYCFVENLRKTGKMAESEFQVLSSWFDFLLGCLEIDLSVDLIVYLKTDPEVALQRVRERSRGEEHLISEDYIRDLHTLHEDWLIHHKFPVPAPVVVVDANKDVKDMKLVFEKIAELVQNNKVNDLTTDVSEDDNKENLNIQVKSSKRFFTVTEKEVRKRTCVRSTE